MGNILESLGQLLSPIGTLFHYVFYEPVFNVLMLVFGLVHNFALAIIVLTILIRVALIPLTRAQLKSQQEMQRLQPELKRIQQQYRNDMVRMREEQQALYREHGVNPAKGCLPLLVQMPFLYALYYAFYTVLRIPTPLPKACQGLIGHAINACLINQDIYPFLPHFTAATVPQTWFIWTDLATPDRLHILPILAGVLTFLQLRMAMPVKKPKQPGAPPDQMSQATSTMQFIMPFITVFIGMSFPAGLALYWCFSTGFSAVQQYFINGRNFGSLFVGVPGMEHLVPPPKDLTATSLPQIPARGARGPAGEAPGGPGAPAEGGWRGLMKQLRESMMAAGAGPPSAESQATEVAQNGAGNGRNGAIREQRTVKPASGSGGSPYPPSRRPRPGRESAKLVRPASLPAPSPEAPSEISPEEEIKRAGKSSLNGKTLLPEQAIARESAVSPGTNGKNGNAPRPAGQNKGTGGPSSGQSRPSGSNYRKGAPGHRGGRPKGGR